MERWRVWSDGMQRRQKEGKGKTEKGFLVDRGDGCDFAQASVSLNTASKTMPLWFIRVCTVKRAYGLKSRRDEHYSWKWRTLKRQFTCDSRNSRFKRLCVWNDVINPVLSVCVRYRGGWQCGAAGMSTTYVKAIWMHVSFYLVVNVPPPQKNTRMHMHTHPPPPHPHPPPPPLVGSNVIPSSLSRLPITSLSVATVSKATERSGCQAPRAVHVIVIYLILSLSICLF